MKSLSPIFLACALALAGACPTLSSAASFMAKDVPSGPVSAQDGEQDSSTAASNLSGTWQVTFSSRRGSRQATMQLKEDGDKLSGSFEGQRGSAPLTGSLNGNQVSFTVKMPRREVSFTGKVDGSKMSGTSEQGGSWSATRQ